VIHLDTITLGKVNRGTEYEHFATRRNSTRSLYYRPGCSIALDVDSRRIYIRTFTRCMSQDGNQ
jgi:hypothetical protein